MAKPKTRTKRKAASKSVLSRLSLRLSRTTLVILSAVILLTLIYALASVHALASYKTRILESDTLSFTGSIALQAQDLLAPLNSNMAFSGKLDRRSATAASLSFLGNWGGRDYSGESLTKDKLLYFNISGPEMPVIRYRQSSFLFPLESSKWYSAKADESLYDNFCELREPATAAGKLQFYRAVKTMKFVPSPLVNFLAFRDGQRTTHLQASVRGAQVAELFRAMQNAMPPDCASFNTLGLGPDDLKHVSAHIDLYTNTKHDTTVITLNDKTLGAKATITLDTSAYNTPVAISAPSNAINLNDVYARFGLD